MLSPFLHCLRPSLLRVTCCMCVLCRSILLLGLDPTFITTGWIRAVRPTCGVLLRDMTAVLRVLNINRNCSFLIGVTSRWLLWSPNDFHLLGPLGLMKGREQVEEELFAVKFALAVCQWHKPALQMQAERYLISEAFWCLGLTKLSTAKAHVDSNYFPTFPPLLSMVISSKKWSTDLLTIKESEPFSF